jgi:uncharacterized protein
MKNNILDVYVRPGSYVAGVEGMYDRWLKIKISAPPQKGKANRELIDLLSEIIGVSKNKIEIISGISSNYKKIRINTTSNKNYLDIILRSI